MRPSSTGGNRENMKRQVLVLCGFFGACLFVIGLLMNQPAPHTSTAARQHTSDAAADAAYVCKAALPLAKVYYAVLDLDGGNYEQRDPRRTKSMTQLFPLVVEYIESSSGKASPPPGWADVRAKLLVAEAKLPIWAPAVIHIMKACDDTKRVCAGALDSSATAAFKSGFMALLAAQDAASLLDPLATKNASKLCWTRDFETWATRRHDVKFEER